MENKIIYRNDNNISWIIFNRENKLNALDYYSWKQLHDYLLKANNDSSKVVVLTGNGKAFSAGDDINSMYNLNSIDESKKFFDNLYNAIEAILDLKKPLISLVNGLAYGGGCEILLLSDIVIASENSKFAMPEGKLGLIPPMAVTIGYKLLGRKIIRLLLTGEEIDAYEAKEVGIVDYISDNPDNKLNEVISLINKVDNESIKSIKSWTEQDKKLLEKAVTELSFMALKVESKEKMKSFINKK